MGSLETFAKDKLRKRCFLCAIEERDEVEKAKQAGVETKHIVAWLIEEKGYSEDEVKIAQPKMGHHFSVHMRRSDG